MYLDRLCCTSTASASSSTGCRRTSRATSTAWPTSTARTSTSTPTRARASIPDWNSCIFNYGRNEVRSFLLSQRAVLARPLPRRRPARGCRRLDALPRLLAQGRASGSPTSYGGRENLEAIDFLRQLNEAVYRDHPGRADDRRGVDRLADGVAADLRRRARLRHEVGHGLDARHARVLRAATRSTASTTTTSSPSASGTRSPRTSSCRSRTTRWCTARARCSARCRATTGRSSPTCGCCSATCARSRARSCCSWAASSASGASGSTTTASTGSCSQYADARRACSAGSRDLNRLYRERAGAARARLPTGRLRVDRLQRRASTASLSFLRKRRAAGRRRARRLQLHAGAARTNYRVGVPRGGVLARAAQQRRAAATAAAAWATSAASTRRRSPRTGAITRSR